MSGKREAENEHALLFALQVRLQAVGVELVVEQATDQESHSEWSSFACIDFRNALDLLFKTTN